MGKSELFSKQQQRILDYLADNGSITGGEAHYKLGILNFSARLSELKDKGFKFKFIREKGKNIYGDKISYNRYMFAEGEE